jgi:hypothetical protein
MSRARCVGVIGERVSAIRGSLVQIDPDFRFPRRVRKTSRARSAMNAGGVVDCTGRFACFTRRDPSPGMADYVGV